jgi:hypothetical protein
MKIIGIIESTILSATFLVSCGDVRPKPDAWHDRDYEVEYNPQSGDSKLVYVDPTTGKTTNVVDLRLEQLGVNDTYIKIACSDYNSIFYFYLTKKDGQLGELSEGLTGDELEEVEERLNLPDFSWTIK